MTKDEASAQTSGEANRCLEAIRTIVAGNDPREYFQDVSGIGPGLAHALAWDQLWFPFGEPMILRRSSEGKTTIQMGRFLRADDLAAFLRLSELNAILSRLVEGQPRPASQEEVSRFCDLKDAEGALVAVIEKGDNRILMRIDEGGRVRWIDLISAYPLASVASNWG